MTPYKRTTKMALLCSAALLNSAVMAHAQQQTTDLDPITIGVSQGTAEPAEIGIVPSTSSVGTKSTLPLARTPQSISIVTGQELEQRQVQSTSEALRYTPGVTSEPYGADPRSDWIRVRGYQTREYLDGLKLARGAFAWPRVEPYFLQRYEVLKGPTGSLYGQTPPGGLINMVSKKPTAQSVRQIGLQFGDPKRAQISADFGGKLSEDGTFTYRLSGLWRDADTNVDYVNDDRAALYGAVTWQPSEQTSLTLQGYSIDDNAKSVQFLPASGTLRPNPNGTLPRDRFTGEPDWDNHDLKQKMAGYLFAHEFQNGVTLSHKLRWSETDYDLKVARPLGYLPGSDSMLFRNAVNITDKTTALNTDTNLTFRFETGAVQHTILAGFDYLTQDTQFGQAFGNIAPLDAYNPVYGAAPSSLTQARDTQTDLRQTGLYLQDEIAVNDWTVVLSARNDWYDREDTNSLTSSKTENSGNQFSWRAGVLYSFDNGLSPYASYATSFDPIAGVNTDTGEAFKPTQSKQAEIGLKYQPAGMNALFTFAAFDMREENTIVSNGLTRMQIGESQVRGVELEARTQLTSGLSLSAAYAYLDTEITSGETDPDNGNRLPYVPENEASLWLSYDFDGVLNGLTLAGGLRYAGSIFGDTGNQIETGDYVLADLALSYDLGASIRQMQGARFDLSIANVADKEFVSICDNETSCYWGAGRTIRASLVYDF